MRYGTKTQHKTCAIPHLDSSLRQAQHSWFHLLERFQCAVPGLEIQQQLDGALVQAPCRIVTSILFHIFLILGHFAGSGCHFCVPNGAVEQLDCGRKPRRHLEGVAHEGARGAKERLQDDALLRS